MEASLLFFGGSMRENAAIRTKNTGLIAVTTSIRTKKRALSPLLFLLTTKIGRWDGKQKDKMGAVREWDEWVVSMTERPEGP